MFCSGGEECVEEGWVGWREELCLCVPVNWFACAARTLYNSNGIGLRTFRNLKLPLYCICAISPLFKNTGVLVNVSI